MKKKRIKKFNLKKFISFLVFIIVFILVCKYLMNIRLKNIIILNNNYYNDETIIETASLENYPKFFFINKNKIKKKLKKLDLIEDVKVTKKKGYILIIEIKEKKILYYDRSNDLYKVSDNNKYKLDNVNGIPTLINFIPSDIEERFASKFKDIDSSVISLISEIEYDKTAYDSERFLLTMNDGNSVYVNIVRLNLLNKYIDIVKNLDNKKGILYLDSGNYFEVKQK
ncbi:MAG: FtsQ-type POTRA domain-containing protein [Bacilli bacterium]|nr:FtsQ-type POTRA domain-containing protein [Bacilli bacterium]